MEGGMKGEGLKGEMGSQAASDSKFKLSIQSLVSQDIRRNFPGVPRKAGMKSEGGKDGNLEE